MRKGLIRFIRESAFHLSLLIYSYIKITKVKQKVKRTYVSRVKSEPLKNRMLNGLSLVPPADVRCGKRGKATHAWSLEGLYDRMMP